MTKVKIYSTPTCPWCKKAKEFFKERKIKFEDIDVSSDQKAQDEMVEKSGQMGVPVIEINEQLVIGFDPEKIEKLIKKE